MKPTLGTNQEGRDIQIDVQRLVETRLLVTATSGAGKSWALRRILEQTHGHVQQIVIDPEDEFHTLREKFDYVLAGRNGGDCPADVRSTQLLATKLLQLGVSAIIGIYELPHHDRIRFVRLFLESLVDAPKNLWHPCLIVIDEAHIFSPESGKGEAESKAAVADLMSRGRKRGFAGLLATQRYSKLDKDAASMCTNVMVGRFTLDVDVKRAVDALGFMGRDDQQRIRSLNDGYFYCHGPALTPTVELVHVGPVSTTHPRAGQRAAAPAPPQSTIKKVLSELADLPAEAEKKAKGEAELRAEIQQLQRDLRAAKTTIPAPQIIEKPVLGQDVIQRLEAIADSLQNSGQNAITVGSLVADALKLTKAPERLTKPPERLTTQPKRLTKPSESNGDLTGPERRILDAVAWLESLGITAPEQAAVAFLAGYTVDGGSFKNPRGHLNQAGYVEYVQPGRIRLTQSGWSSASIPDRPLDATELQGRVKDRLPGPERKILDVLIAAYPQPMSNEEVARAAHYEPTGGSFKNPRGRLRSLGLIDYPATGMLVARSLLFLE